MLKIRQESTPVIRSKALTAIAMWLKVSFTTLGGRFQGSSVASQCNFSVEKGDL